MKFYTNNIRESVTNAMSDSVVYCLTYYQQPDPMSQGRGGGHLTLVQTLVTEQEIMIIFLIELYKIYKII